MSRNYRTSTVLPIPLWFGLDHKACELASRQETAFAGEQAGIVALPKTNVEAPGGRWNWVVERVHLLKRREGKNPFAFFFLQGAMGNQSALFIWTLITENQVIATPGKRKIKKTIRCKRASCKCLQLWPRGVTGQHTALSMLRLPDRCRSGSPGIPVVIKQNEFSRTKSNHSFFIPNMFFAAMM